jgi:uncharacterized tellurite resistance protein B-like protein
MLPSGMLNSIRSFFDSKIAQPTATEGEGDSAVGAHAVQLAAAALLLELAHADDEFSPEERSYIEGALARQFNLTEDEVANLIELAGKEHHESVDHFQFTSLISENFDLGQKVVLAEVMWGLVAADGQIASHEAYLVRKISNLLDLEPGYLNAAKKKATGG